MKHLGTFSLFCAILVAVEAKQPHIVFVLADDLGWNDVGFHNPLINSPNIDKLATHGVELNQSYVLPTCSPSRHAFLSGRYPFRDGLQHMVFTDVHPKCIPLDVPLLPEKLKEAGYSTHLVGKWHVGFCNEACTPNNRGFDSFYGYYGGENDHYLHSRGGAFDFRDNDKVVSENEGQFSTPLFTRKAVDLINEHETTDPLFLYMAYDMTHYPIQVPEKYEQIYSHVKDEIRRKYLGMVSVMDESVGEIVGALNDKGMMDDTLIVFMSDNGGQPLYAGNNYPLRGGKLTLWEGGTRAPTVVSGGFVKKTGTVDGMFHVTDWYPTLINLAGGETGKCGEPAIDGIDQTNMIFNDGESNRKEMIYNMDINSDKFAPIAGYAAYRYGSYKLLYGYPGAGDLGLPSPWVKPSEQCEVEDDAGDVQCQFKGAVTGESKKQIREKQDDKMGDVDKKMKELTIQLFNLKDDPIEKKDLAEIEPEMVSLLKERLEKYMEEVTFPMWPRPVGNPGKRLQGGFHAPGWCSTEELAEAVQTSRLAAKRPEIIANTCEK